MKTHMHQARATVPHPSKPAARAREYISWLLLGPVLPVEPVFLENQRLIGRMILWVLGGGAAADGIRGVTPGRWRESRAFGEARDARWETDPAIWKGPHG